MAEWAFSQILLAGKGFFHNLNGCGFCGERAEEFCFGNYGNVVGLIGMGKIATLLAQKLRDTDNTVYACDPYLSEERTKELNVRKCSLEVLFSEANVISNHLPDLPETVGMLNYDLFRRIPKYGVFINTGRGRQVVEEDLVRALTEEPNRVALLDVTFPEPSPTDSPLRNRSNIILTPHIAGSIGKEVFRLADFMIEEFGRFQKDEPLLYEVTESMLDTMA